MRNNDNYTNFALISNISPTQNPALTSFENEIYSMVKNIEFMKDRYDFQDKLKEDTNELRSSKNLYVLAGKLANLYKMSDTDHNRLLDNTSPAIIEKSKTVQSKKLKKDLKNQLNRLILVKRGNVTLAALPLSPLTLSRMDFFGAAQGWEGGGLFCPLPKTRHTYPTMMKLGTVIPYLRQIQKMYKSRDTFLGFC